MLWIGCIHSNFLLYTNIGSYTHFIWIWHTPFCVCVLGYTLIPSPLSNTPLHSTLPLCNTPSPSATPPVHQTHHPYRDLSCLSSCWTLCKSRNVNLFHLFENALYFLYKNLWPQGSWLRSSIHSFWLVFIPFVKCCQNCGNNCRSITVSCSSFLIFCIGSLV